MRALLALLLLVHAGCSCDDDDDPSGPDGGKDSGLDASRDSGRDAARDALPDGPEGAASDRYAPGECEPIEVEQIERDMPLADCGPGCLQATRTPGRVQTYDVFGTMLAHVDLGPEPDTAHIGWVDLKRDEGSRFAIPGEGLPPSVATDGTYVYYGSATVEVDRGLLWKVDPAAGCRILLEELLRLDGNGASVPDDIDAEGRWLVWYDLRGGPLRQDLFAWDLEEAREIALTNEITAASGTNSRFGDTVVYLGWARSPRRISALDIVAGAARQLWESRGEQDNPSVNGNRVAFQAEVDFGSSNTDIHAVDLAFSGKHTVVCDQEDAQGYPDVYGDLVVWEDHRNERPGEYNENIDVYGKDLASGSEVAITSLPGIENRPRLWESTVYFPGADR